MPLIDCASIAEQKREADAIDANKVIGAKEGAEPVKSFESAPVKSLTEAEQEVLNNRKVLGHELGIENALESLGRRTQDIFQMIHSRYQSINSQGEFFGQ